MLVDIANEQVKTQEVYVLIVNESFQQYLIDKFSPKVNVILNHRKPNSRSILPFIRLNRILRKLHPDVVHLHNVMLARVIMSWVSRGVFLTVHALHLPLKGVRRGIKLIAISEAVKEDVLSRGNYDVVTIPNGISIGCINKREKGKQLSGGKMRIVQVGRLDASKKGQDILIDAISILRKRGNNSIEVDFIGVGTSEVDLKTLAEEKDVIDRIRFVGLRDRDYIYSHLKDYDLMCHPARFEGFGLTVAEGMAAMLPVLVSDEGGPFEIIGHGKYGMAFEMENAEACADKIEYIYKNYSEILRKTTDAYEHVRVFYSIERMVKDYLKIYSKI